MPTLYFADDKKYDTRRRPVEYTISLFRWRGAAGLSGSYTAMRASLVDICRERSAYHIQMQKKWSQAALFPWSHVDPDPPRPPVEFDGGDSY